MALGDYHHNVVILRLQCQCSIVTPDRIMSCCDANAESWHNRMMLWRNANRGPMARELSHVMLQCRYCYATRSCQGVMQTLCHETTAWWWAAATHITKLWHNFSIILYQGAVQMLNHGAFTPCWDAVQTLFHDTTASCWDAASVHPGASLFCHSQTSTFHNTASRRQVMASGIITVMTEHCQVTAKL